MNRIEIVASNPVEKDRLSIAASELHNRYRRWSFDIQTCESINETVLDARAMYGWRPPGIAPNRPPRANLTQIYKYNIREVSLAFACILCAVIFSIALICLALRGLTPSGSLLVGCALVIVPYEACILARRIFANHHD